MFEAWSRIAISASETVLTATGAWTVRFLADFSGDGKGDLRWSHADGCHANWLMDGNTIIAAGALLTAGSGFTSAAVGDYNADGRTDILWKHTDGRIANWLMNGTAAMVGGSYLAPVGAGLTPINK